MSVANLVVKTTGRAAGSAAVGPLDLTASATAATTGIGDFWASTGRELLWINNASGSPVTVTLALGATNAAVDGQVPASPTISVAAGHAVVVGPFPSVYKDGSGNCNVTYSAITSVTVCAFILATN